MIKHLIKTGIMVAAVIGAAPLAMNAQEAEVEQSADTSIGRDVGQAVSDMQKMYGKGGVLADIYENDGENVGEIVENGPRKSEPADDFDASDD